MGWAKSFAGKPVPRWLKWLLVSVLILNAMLLVIAMASGTEAGMTDPAPITEVNVYDTGVNFEARLRREPGDSILRQMVGTIATQADRIERGEIAGGDRIRDVGFLFRAPDPSGSGDEPIAQFEFDASALRSMAEARTVAEHLGAARRSSARIPYGTAELREACDASPDDVRKTPICIEAAK